MEQSPTLVGFSFSFKTERITQCTGDADADEDTKAITIAPLVFFDIGQRVGHSPG